MPKPYYVLHDLQVTNRYGATHQIDTILLCPYFLLVHEIKNITSLIEIDGPFHQFNRTTVDGRVESLMNPFHQIELHVKRLRQMVQQEGIVLPISYEVFSATKNAILSPILLGRPIFHVTGLRYEVEKLLSRCSNSLVEASVLERFVKVLLVNHAPINGGLNDLLTGVPIQV